MKDELIAWGKGIAVVGVSMLILNEIGRRMWSVQYAVDKCAKEDAKAAKNK